MSVDAVIHKTPALIRLRRLTFACSIIFAAGCETGTFAGPDPGAEASDTAKVALNDLGTGKYSGFQGGLYPSGSNGTPSAHAVAGFARARNIRPLDANGNPGSGGRYVLLSVGMSNTSQEFCGASNASNCLPQTFMRQAANDASVNKSMLVIVNGAQGGRDAVFWTSPSAATFEEVRERLAQHGVSERQVQIVWLKQANAGPTRPLPDTNADAYELETLLGAIVRALRVRYPNLQQVFLSSRTYGGYASTALNPEPYAYESGFAVKWLIQAQVEQMQQGTIVDARAGDLNYDAVAPWITWGPYPWADGTRARSDGLRWERADFVADGTHPSESGRAKMGTMLLAFFSNSPWTRCWFIAGLSC